MENKINNSFSPEGMPEINKRSAYIFTYKNHSFTCRANDQEEANRFFNDSLTFSEGKRMRANDEGVQCEVASDSDDSQDKIAA